MVTTYDGNIAIIKRLQVEGVGMTERDDNGFTAIMVAAGYGHATTVKFLHTAGASITEKDNYGCSALHYTAMYGKLLMVQYFLQDAEASISDATDEGETVWGLLKPQNADPFALVALPKVMLMLDDAPPAFADKLSPAHAELTTRGRQDSSACSCRHFWSSSKPRSSSTAPCLMCCCQSSPNTPRLPLRTCGQTGYLPMEATAIAGRI
jgi:hypothetical protein